MAHFFEDVFITQPRERIFTLPKQACMALFALSGGTGAFLLTKKGIGFINEGPNGAPKYQYLDRKQNHIAGLAGLGLAAGAYTMVYGYLLDREERKQLEQYMFNWPGSKEFLPNELHAAFERLAQQYKDKNPQYPENCRKTLRILKNAIYERFPQKYASKKWGDFFNDTRFNVNVHFDLIRAIEKTYNFVRAHII